VRDMRVRCLRLMMVGVSAAMAPPPSAIGVVVRPSSMGSTYGGNRCEFPGGLGAVLVGGIGGPGGESLYT
jgi:hypothetical protein